MLSKSCSEGAYKSQYNLAVCYAEGVGVEQSDKKSFEWMLLAAKQGLPEAQYYVGQAFLLGDGINYSVSDSFYWTKLAADGKFLKANYNLGLMYYHGTVGEVDFQKASLCFKKLENESFYGAAQAKYNLGCMYWLGQGVPQSKEKAFSCYKAAAQIGLPEAHYNLGHLYFNGEEVSKDEEEAASHWEMAAQKGNVKSLNLIAVCYFLARGRQKSITKAIQFWTLAANSGCAQSQFNLGKIYAGGFGVESDLDQAHHWLVLASEQNFDGASEQLANLLKDQRKIVSFPDRFKDENSLLEMMVKNFQIASPEIQTKFLSRVASHAHIFQIPIVALIEQDETKEIEFKATFSTPTKTNEDGKSVPVKVIRHAALKEIAGFLNSNDGTLLIGVADGKNTNSGEPEPRGIEADNFGGDQDKYARQIMELARNAFGEANALQIDISFEEIETKTICRINCSKSPNEVYLKSREYGEQAFIRIGTSTIEPSKKRWVEWIKKNFND